MYKPHRTERYDHVADLLEEIEAIQCHDCKFREAYDQAMPMCIDLAGKAVLESPIDEWYANDSGQVWCAKYEQSTPPDVRQEEQWDQDTLPLA